MNTIRDGPASDTDSKADDEPTSRDTFLMEEGLELLAHYRAIENPQVRLLIRQLIAVASECRPREQ